VVGESFAVLKRGSESRIMNKEDRDKVRSAEKKIKAIMGSKELKR
jgi:hypothetical protein